MSSASCKRRSASSPARRIDGRNQFTEEELSGTSFVYYSVGRPNLNKGVREQSPALQF
ncbi:hypothetical protein HGI30_05860 [Paenibacillus albicereus]|uniref:Uncharacterized protein n=1 Tax=Paenibacillus albicereus TaxID=2726185 RepID=A0A6H2GRT9_9BACL|nr:hypothetical protein HGI30_05860 [Paenibacillus albicereus]